MKLTFASAVRAMFNRLTKEPDKEVWEEWFPERLPTDTEWAIINNMHVRGKHAYSGASQLFVRRSMTEKTPVQINLVREPTNRHDTNAIRVDADLNGPTPIGYLPREHAAAIAIQYPDHMPLRAELFKIATLRRPKRKDEAFAIFVSVIRPAKRSAWWKANMKGKAAHQAAPAD